MQPAAAPLCSTPRRLAALLACLAVLLPAGCASLSPPALIEDTEEPSGAPPPPDSPAEYAFQQGEEFANAEMWSDAVEAYTQALQLDPEYFDALLARSRAYVEQSQHENALTDLDRAVELQPDNSRARGDRAECLWRLSQYESAIEELDRALPLVAEDDDWTRAWLHALRGDSLRSLERYDEAVAGLTLAIDLLPDYGFALSRRGETYRMQDKLDEALADLGRAIELEPEESYSYASRGETYHQLGRLAEALEDLDKALELQSDYPWAVDRRNEVLAALEEESGGGGGGEGDGGDENPAVVDTASLPLVAVMDFQVENLAASEGRLIVDLLSSALASRQVFRVLERSQRDSILKEIEFSLSACSDESCQLKAGRLLAADRIVVGSVGKVGGRFILNARLLSVETGEVAATSYQVFKSLEELVDGCEQVAFSLSEI